MLLLLLTAALHQPASPPARDLDAYLRIAALYRTADHSAALRQILEWPLGDVEAAARRLCDARKRFRETPLEPGDIGLGIVEAAVLLHAEAWLSTLRGLRHGEAEVHLATSVAILGSSRGGRIDRRDYYLALAASALAIGLPATARPFAEAARRAGPMDAEVSLVSGCVAESLAEEHVRGHRDSAAAHDREEGETFLQDALSLEPGLTEARLRLGKLLLDQHRTIEAEPHLEEAERRGDDRQRYLARVFLGRLAERRGRREDATRFLERALEGWPDSQAARLGLALVRERSSGPAASRPLVAASLAASQRLDRAADPWWLYPFGPPGLANTVLRRVFARALER